MNFKKHIQFSSADCRLLLWAPIQTSGKQSMHVLHRARRGDVIIAGHAKAILQLCTGCKKGQCSGLPLRNDIVHLPRHSGADGLLDVLADPPVQRGPERQLLSKTGTANCSFSTTHTTNAIHL